MYNPNQHSISSAQREVYLNACPYNPSNAQNGVNSNSIQYRTHLNGQCAMSYYPTAFQTNHQQHVTNSSYPMPTAQNRTLPAQLFFLNRFPPTRHQPLLLEIYTAGDTARLAQLPPAYSYQPDPSKVLVPIDQSEYPDFCEEYLETAAAANIDLAELSSSIAQKSINEQLNCLNERISKLEGQSSNLLEQFDEVDVANISKLRKEIEESKKQCEEMQCVSLNYFESQLDHKLENVKRELDVIKTKIERDNENSITLVKSVSVLKQDLCALQTQEKCVELLAEQLCKNTEIINQLTSENHANREDLKQLKKLFQSNDPNAINKATENSSMKNIVQERKPFSSFNSYQRAELEKCFQQNKHESIWKQQELAGRLNLPTQHIEEWTWFGNQCEKQRKVGREDTESSEAKSTKWSEAQLQALRRIFAKTHYPHIFQREELARQIGSTQDRIQIWFNQQRAKAIREQRLNQLNEQIGHSADKVMEKLEQETQSHLQSTTASSGVSISPIAKTREEEKVANQYDQFSLTYPYLTTSQLICLKAYFSNNSCPDINARREIACVLKLTEPFVQKWFEQQRKCAHQSSPCNDQMPKVAQASEQLIQANKSNFMSSKLSQPSASSFEWFR